MKPLEDFIDGFHSDFGLLNQALKKDGFGPKPELSELMLMAQLALESHS